MTPTDPVMDIPPDPHATILALRDGAVHTHGTLLSGAGDVHSGAWRAPREEAARLRRPVRLSIGCPCGTVEAYALAADGTAIKLHRHPPILPPEPPDPRWTDGMPDHHYMLDTVRTAERAGDWLAVQTEAGHLAAQLHDNVGDQHPHTVLAWELQAHFALRAGDWATAARLYVLAASRRYALRCVGVETDRTLRNAVHCWLRAQQRPEVIEVVGYDLAHLLIRAVPGQPGPISAVLSRLELSGHR